MTKVPKAAKRCALLPPPFVEIRVVNDTSEVPWNGKTMGELQIRGPWISNGHYKHDDSDNPDSTSDRWFRTGDIATINAEGYMKITDRTKDLVKSGGEWISSVDLENAIMADPRIKEAAVVAVPHPKWQERPIAAVVLKDEFKGKVSGSEILEFITPKFAKWFDP